MRLIDVDAAIDCIKSGIKEDGNFESDAIHLIEFLNVFARSNKVEALPMDKLCALLGKNADCPPEHSPVQDHCKENCAECWKSVLKEWTEEQDAAD